MISETINEKSLLLASQTKGSAFSDLIASPFQCLPKISLGCIGTSNNVDDDLDATDNELVHDLPAPPLVSTKIVDKLTQLRTQMKKHNIGVYIIPSEDEHQSEYTALSDKRREFISGFTGSAGIAIVTLESSDLLGKAALSTDGRYFLQAEKQLDPKYWKLLKQGSKNSETWQDFAINRAKYNQFSNIISCDPRLISLDVGEFFVQKVKALGSIRFKPLLEINLVDEIWKDRPTRSQEQIYQLPMKYSGESTQSKLTRVRDLLKSNKFESSHLIITNLDEIAWLFNLRSDSDIPFNPVFFAYSIVSLNSVSLYVDHVKIDNSSPELKNYLSSIPNLKIKPYKSFYSDLSSFRLSIHSPSISLVLPSRSSTTFALLQSIPSSTAKQSIKYNSLVSYLKLVKNETELFNARIAQQKDSIAFVLFASWLEDQLIRKNRRLTEYDASCKILDIRTKFPNFKGLSYETIASSGANAAIIHYAPTKEVNSVIDPSKVFLVDSGGHYLEGTTDITRTFKFGSEAIDEEYKKYYTLVLKGHLAVAMAQFPPNSRETGTILDAYSRQPLWNEGLDFNHGTGHGVGSFGNVHESPLYILTTSGGPNSEILFKPGAILTIEPGYYIDSEVGFRIESEIEITESSKGKTRLGQNYLRFNYLTQVPFCRKLIDTSYLSPAEIKWVNAYHSEIRQNIGSRLKDIGEKRALKWLTEETKSI